MSLTDQLKKPPVLIAGAAIGLVVLLVASSRGGAPAANTDGMARIASINASYNVAAGGYEVEKAKAAYAYAANRDNNNLGLQIQAMKFFENIFAVAQAATTRDHEISASVTQNMVTNSTAIVRDKMNNELRRFLVPYEAQTAVSIAQIQAASAERLASISAANQQTLANIYASRSQGGTGQQIGYAAQGIGNLLNAFNPLLALF